jgi:hypothetical protein
MSHYFKRQKLYLVKTSTQMPQPFYNLTMSKKNACMYVRNHHVGM